MADESIGTARVDVVVNTATMESGLEAAKRRVSGLGAEAEAQFNKASASTKRYADNLLRQAEMLGKTRAEQIAYNAQTRIAGELGDQIAKRALARNAELAASTLSVGKSAKEINFALRGLPAQITDIFTSLASGQRPMMVLLQQGGQLKDMFGGIGPAASALGRSLLGLINPITVTAAAAAALVFAWKEGSDEAVAFNKALITTGNYAGVTAEQLQAMATNIAMVTGTQHAAAAALAEVAGSGRFTAEQVSLVGRAAVAMSEMTGQATSDTIKQFQELGEKPVEAILKLNDTQHFLTAAIYEQIKALEDQGRAQDAAQLAMQTYADVVEKRRADVVENLGLIEEAWNGIKDAALGAVDAALSVGRQQTDQQKFDVLVENRDSAKSLIDRGMGSSAFLGTTAQKFYDDATQKLLKMADDRAAKEKEQAKKAAEQRLVQDRVDSDRQAAAYLPNAQKRAQEYLKAENEFNERIKRAEKAGDTALADRERQQKATTLAGINAKFADKGAAKQAKFWDTSITGDTHADLTKSITKEIDGFKKEADQWARSTTAASAYQQTLRDMLDTRQRAIDLQVASIGMGQREIEQQQALIGIDEDYNRKKADLQRRQQNSTSALERDGYQKQLDDLAKYHDERIRMELDGFRREEEARKNAALGAQAALADFTDAAGNVAGQTYDVFSNAFDGMTDAITKFVTTGKLDFRGLVASILSDLAKMEARILASQALQAILGSYGQSYGGTVGAGDGSGFTYNMPVYGGGRASGGPVAGGNLYEVTEGGRPELLTSGGRTYLLMGADGGHVTPASRAGLTAAPAAGGGAVVNQVINVDASGNASEQTSGGNEDALRQFAGRMKAVAQQAILEEQRPGGSLWRMRQPA